MCVDCSEPAAPKGVKKKEHPIIKWDSGISDFLDIMFYKGHYNAYYDEPYKKGGSTRFYPVFPFIYVPKKPRSAYPEL